MAASSHLSGQFAPLLLFLLSSVASAQHLRRAAAPPSQPDAQARGAAVVPFPGFEDHITRVFPSLTPAPIATGLGLAESPLWLPKEKALLFSDLLRNEVYRWAPNEGVTKFLLNGGGMTGDGQADDEDKKAPVVAGPNGIVLDSDDSGALLVCQHGSRKVVRIDPTMISSLGLQEEGLRVVAAGYDGRPFNSPNDLALSERGDLYFTDPPYGLIQRGHLVDDTTLLMPNSSALGFSGIYRVSKEELERARGEGHDTEGAAVELLDASLSRPNGIAVTRDQRRLLVSDSSSEATEGGKGKADGMPTPAWYLFDIADDFTLANRRLLLDPHRLSTILPPNSHGTIDGLAIAPNGLAFATGPGGVYVIHIDESPEGRASVWGRLHMGDSFRPTNVEVGADGHLYVSGIGELWRIPLHKEVLSKGADGDIWTDLDKEKGQPASGDGDDYVVAPAMSAGPKEEVDLTRRKAQGDNNPPNNKAVIPPNTEQQQQEQQEEQQESLDTGGEPWSLLTDAGVTDESIAVNEESEQLAAGAHALAGGGVYHADDVAVKPFGEADDAMRRGEQMVELLGLEVGIPDKDMKHPHLLDTATGLKQAIGESLGVPANHIKIHHVTSHPVVVAFDVISGGRYTSKQQLVAAWSQALADPDSAVNRAYAVDSSASPVVRVPKTSITNSFEKLLHQEEQKRQQEGQESQTPDEGDGQRQPDTETATAEDATTPPPAEEDDNVAQKEQPGQGHKAREDKTSTESSTKAARAKEAPVANRDSPPERIGGLSGWMFAVIAVCSCLLLAGCVVSARLLLCRVKGIGGEAFNTPQRQRTADGNLNVLLHSTRSRQALRGLDGAPASPDTSRTEEPRRLQTRERPEGSQHSHNRRQPQQPQQETFVAEQQSQSDGDPHEPHRLPPQPPKRRDNTLATSPPEHNHSHSHNQHQQHVDVSTSVPHSNSPCVPKRPWQWKWPRAFESTPAPKQRQAHCKTAAKMTSPGDLVPLSKGDESSTSMYHGSVPSPSEDKAAASGASAEAEASGASAAATPSCASRHTMGDVDESSDCHRHTDQRSNTQDSNDSNGTTTTRSVMSIPLEYPRELRQKTREKPQPTPRELREAQQQTAGDELSQQMREATPRSKKRAVASATATATATATSSDMTTPEQTATESMASVVSVGGSSCEGLGVHMQAQSITLSGRGGMDDGVQDCYTEGE
ncbi:unnamed protein product [Vitrella brassicaformis CCMP3155]|uniref:SMP-30/Gluconolactonase/LRE-like region domain-containing protein n=2 Tax=Vitrella brassicaformis TaxID=1169539 RepID=A0A0G4ENW5_VITBC|nr:unnamed protein product [Vitrella brassicaformis CCMP3155]|eukprot:CEL99313.1 unnamed protein product [Vitrella brassicaformis CCMP3155]